MTRGDKGKYVGHFSSQTNVESVLKTREILPVALRARNLENQVALTKSK